MLRPLRWRFAASLALALLVSACASTESGAPAEPGSAPAPSAPVTESAPADLGSTTDSEAPASAAASYGEADGLSASPAPAEPSGELGALARRARPEAPRRQGSRPGLLTAGDVDDNLNWEAFQRYAERARRSQSRSLPHLDLGERITVRVVDATGQPVANAHLTVEATGGSRARRLTTETGTDGRLALFPAYDFGPDVRRLRVRAQAPGGQGEPVTLGLDDLSGDRTVRVQLRDAVGERPHALDLAVVIDVTGSMGDELRYLTDEFENIVRRVEQRYRGTDLRFALVAYRDHGDDLVVRSFPFVRSAREMQQRLAGLRAEGGGDYPEAMDEALEAATALDWRTGEVARVAFLVADAPPHEGAPTERFLGAVRQARAAGVRVYPLAASGVGDEAEYLMRHAAVLTQARHLFLTDDSGIGHRHQEPKVDCYVVTALDGLLTRVLASELEGRRVEPMREEIVREVGDYDAGVCESGPVAVRDAPPQPRRGGLGYD